MRLKKDIQCSLASLIKLVLATGDMNENFWSSSLVLTEDGDEKVSLFLFISTENKQTVYKNI